MSEEEDYDSSYLSEDGMEEVIISVGSHFERKRIREEYKNGYLSDDFIDYFEEHRMKKKQKLQEELVSSKLTLLLDYCRKLSESLNPEMIFNDDFKTYEKFKIKKKLTTLIANIEEDIRIDMDYVDCDRYCNELMRDKKLFLSYCPELLEQDEKLNREYNNKINRIKSEIYLIDGSLDESINNMKL